MHPNKFRCAWLGQGGALKVISKGFEGAMMLGAKKSIKNFGFAQNGKNRWSAPVVSGG